jgi:hypothetical protein
MSSSGSVVSGEPVAFYASDENAFVLRAVKALSELPPSLPRWALIGGVAVSMNLAGVHRPTGDLDSVSLNGEETLALLVAGGAARTLNGVALGHAGARVEFDVIDVSDGDPEHGGFLAHRLALDTARAMRVIVIGRNGGVLAEQSLDVASPGALVAMKLHSAEGRRAQRPEKRSGDLFDIVMLVQRHSAELIADELRLCGQSVLLASCADHADEYFRRQITHTMRSFRSDSRAIVSDIIEDDLMEVARLAELLW